MTYHYNLWPGKNAPLSGFQAKPLDPSPAKVHNKAVTWLEMNPNGKEMVTSSAGQSPFESILPAVMTAKPAQQTERSRFGARDSDRPRQVMIFPSTCRARSRMVREPYGAGCCSPLTPLVHQLPHPLRARRRVPTRKVTSAALWPSDFCSINTRAADSSYTSGVRVTAAEGLYVSLHWTSILSIRCISPCSRTRRSCPAITASLLVQARFSCNSSLTFQRFILIVPTLQHHRQRGLRTT